MLRIKLNGVTPDNGGLGQCTAIGMETVPKDGCVCTQHEVGL
jgi:hypothetical protein